MNGKGKEGEEVRVKMRKFFCMVLSLVLVASFLCINSGAIELTGQIETPVLMRAYSPFDAEVDFGLITEDGIFHFLSVNSGSFDRTITVTERGNYTFAVRNNSSKTINVSGYVKY